MKKSLMYLTIGCLVFTGLMLGAQANAEPTTVVAKVNGEEVVQADIDFVINTFVLPRYKQQNPDKEMAAEERQKIEQDVLQQIETQKLVLQKATELNITVDDAVVQERLKTVKEQQPTIPEDQLKKLLTEDMKIQKTIEQEVVAKITVTDEEIQQFYDANKEKFQEPEQVQASHILAQVKPDAPQADKDAARKKIDEALKLVQSGQDFATVAKEHSECPSAENGGDLGFFGRGDMVKGFEDAAFAMKEGEVSGVVETEFGYHVIKVVGKKAQRDVPLDEVKDRLKQSLTQQKANGEVGKWIEALRTGATIEVMNQ